MPRVFTPSLHRNKPSWNPVNTDPQGQLLTELFTSQLASSASPTGCAALKIQERSPGSLVLSVRR